MRRRLLATGFLLLLGACGAGGSSSADITYRAFSPNGSPADEAAITLACGELDVRLAEFGIDRRVVTPLPPDRIRVVLPDVESARRDEIRKVLEKQEGLKVVLQYLPPE